MCYVVVKDFNKTGCIAYKTEHGESLVRLKRNLRNSITNKNIQLVTISRPTAFREYAPYRFANSEKELYEMIGIKNNNSI